MRNIWNLAAALPSSHSSRRRIQFSSLLSTLNAWRSEIKIKISVNEAWLAVLTFLVMPQLVRAGGGQPRMDALLLDEPITRDARDKNSLQFGGPEHIFLRPNDIHRSGTNPFQIMKTKIFLSFLGSLLSATLASLLNYRFKIVKCSLLLLVSLLALTGCAERIECTIASQPGSASISAPGENFHGGIPVIRRKVTKADRQAGYLVLKGVNARWHSGVNRTIDITVPIKAGEQNFNFCIIRPPGGNLKADLQYDAQIAQQNALKAADEAAARAATARNLALTAEILNGIGAGLQAAQGLQPTTTYTAPPPATSMQRVQCSYCKGKRKNPTDNLSAGVPTFGNDLGTMPCDICGRIVQKPHIHGPCPICHGTGYAR